VNAQLESALHEPRLGFLGVGWIGRQRLKALVESGAAITVVAIADNEPAMLEAAAAHAPGARAIRAIDALLDSDLDGVVIATPSGMHAAQAIAALDRGIAVFCQKPLTRTAREAEAVIDAARRNDRLIDVDFSYRDVAGVPAMRSLVQDGSLGEIYAIDLVFHNAYGPDKPWFYDIAQSGGGSVMDLGIHLIDLASWITGRSDAREISARLCAHGAPLTPPIGEVDDYAAAQWRLGDASVRMTCSWRLAAGCDAVIEAAFYGTRGGVALRNVGGSFYDFTVDRFEGTQRERIASPPDAWGGRTLVRWADRLAHGARFDPEAERLVDVARIVDAIYGR
jgi:predicted dehydrogenase